MSEVTPEQIDDLLPQTQCGLCGYGGCMPYAEAIIFEKAAINLCPPGGVKTLRALGELVQHNPEPYLQEMEEKAKPRLLALIREAECIGCTKCIQACPVDAILGSAKHMHTVISDECTGCELCVAPCPVDCIDMLPLSNSDFDKTKSNLARERFHTREARLQKEKIAKQNARNENSLAIKRNYIEEAIKRAKSKKS